MISIRQRLNRELLGTCYVLIGAALLVTYFYARSAAIHQFDAALRAKALAVSTVTAAGERGVQVAFSDRFLRGFDDAHPRDFFELWDAQGKVLARSESLGSADLPLEAATIEHPRYWNLPLPKERRGRAVGFSFEPKVQRKDGNEGGEERARPRGGGSDAEVRTSQPKPFLVRLVVASDRDDLDDTLQGLALIVGICWVSLLLITPWLLRRVLRRGLSPVDRLSEQAATIHAGALSTRFQVGDLPQELQPIAARLNELLGRLEESFERERQFSADLAHELRTPLAELRALAECALKWPEARDPQTDKETLAVAQHMEGLTVRLLMLARGENRQLISDVQPVDMATLAEETWRAFAARAAERDIAVSFALASERVPADPVLFRSILTNLFDNAVDYTPRGGRIEVRWGEGEPGRVLSVANTTDDLVPSDVERLFQRFWRKEEARTGGKHFGLGLALSRTFAEAMGWELTARLDEGRRLIFSLSRRL